MTDVNAAFAAERMRQMQHDSDRRAFLESEASAGRAVKLPGGRYKFITGWDSGEVFDAKGTIDHGLDMTEDERLALYLADAPAWHGLGTVVPGGLHTAAEVLHAAGLDYTVRKRAAF